MQVSGGYNLNVGEESLRAEMAAMNGKSELQELADGTAELVREVRDRQNSYTVTEGA